jgi:hypothetical protein
VLQRHDDRPEGLTGVGEDVLVPQRSLTVDAAGDHTEVLEPAQSRGEDVAWRAGVRGDVAELPAAEEQLAHHEQ